MNFKRGRDKESLELQLNALVKYCMEISDTFGGGTFDNELGKAFDHKRVEELFSTFYEEVITFLEVLIYDDEILSGHLEEIRGLPDPEGDYVIWLYNVSSLDVALKRALEAEDFERCIEGTSLDRKKIIAKHITRLSQATVNLLEKLTEIVEEFEKEWSGMPIEYDGPDEIPKDADKKLWKAILKGKAGDVVKCPYDDSHHIQIGFGFCPNCTKREGKRKDWVIKELPKPKKKGR